MTICSFFASLFHGSRNAKIKADEEAWRKGRYTRPTEAAWTEPKGHDFSYPVPASQKMSADQWLYGQGFVIAGLGGKANSAIHKITPEFLTRHGLTLDSKLSDAPQPKPREVPANLRLTPEARSAAVARGNRTRAAKRAMTEKLRSELRRSVEEAK